MNETDNPTNSINNTQHHHKKHKIIYTSVRVSCFAIFFHPSNTMPKELKSMFMRMPLSPRNHNGKNVAYKHQSEGALRGPLTCDAHPIESHPIPERQKNKQERR